MKIKIQHIIHHLLSILGLFFLPFFASYAQVNGGDSVVVATPYYQEVDSAYLAEIEMLIAQTEVKNTVKKYNDNLMKDEMKFEYASLVPVVKGLISAYVRHDFITKHPAVFEHTNSRMQDYVVAGSPLAAAWILKAAGVKSRSTTRRMLTANAFALVLAGGLTEGTKHIVSEQRPDLSDNHSFPSGHTALAYVGATVLSREFGHISPWITVGAYSVATGTEILRIKHNAHWVNDVFMGAGIGTVSTNVGYWLADRIFGEEGINKPTMNLKDMARYMKLMDKPSSIALVAMSNMGKNKIEAENLVFSDAMKPLVDDDLHVHLSSFNLAGVEASWYVNPFVSIEALANCSVGQAKVYSSTNNLFTGNTLQVYRGSLGVKGSLPVPMASMRFGLRALAGVRSVGEASFYLNDGRTEYNPMTDYSITLPRNTKFEIGCGLNMDILNGKSHIVGVNFDYYHAFSKITPNRFVLGTAWKILF